MDEYQTGEETIFIVDEISGIIKESIETAIGGNAYQPNRVHQWTTSVVELCLSQLTKLGKPFKYIVTSVIMQKNGAGLHTASSCYWDNNADVQTFRNSFSALLEAWDPKFYFAVAARELCAAEESRKNSSQELEQDSDDEFVSVYLFTVLLLETMHGISSIGVLSIPSQGCLLTVSTKYFIVTGRTNQCPFLNQYSHC
ncbi:uncharacterized protein LOC144596605 isoform X1 [Rhinoraja longicauda]